MDKFGKQHINAGMVFDNIKKALKEVILNIPVVGIKKWREND